MRNRRRVETIPGGKQGSGTGVLHVEMTRQDKNEAFLSTAFLDGGNAAYIEDLYARYKADPASVDASWASFFGKLGDSTDEVEKDVAGPSWQRRDWPQAANGELVSALDGNWGDIAVKVEKALKSAGARLKDVTRLLIFITDIREMTSVTDQLAKSMKGNPITSTLVAVSALAKPGLYVEIEATAVVEK